MKRLSKDQRTTLIEFAGRLDDAREHLDASITLFNAKLTDAWVPVDDAQSHYVEALDEVIEFAQGVVDEIDASYSKESREWRGSKVGDACAAWKEAWEEAVTDFNSYDEVDPPEELELPGCPDGAVLRKLPQKP